LEHQSRELFVSQPETESLRKAVGIPINRSIDLPRQHAVELREVAVEHCLLAAHLEDASLSLSLDPLDWHRSA
jgi:hypothetical protein